MQPRWRRANLIYYLSTVPSSSSAKQRAKTRAPPSVLMSMYNNCSNATAVQVSHLTCDCGLLAPIPLRIRTYTCAHTLLHCWSSNDLP